jgi:hypothetical protein
VRILSRELVKDAGWESRLIRELQLSTIGNGNGQLAGVSVDYSLDGNCIYLVQFSLGNPDDAVWIDNLTVVTVIPEPSTALMMLVGVQSCVGWRRWRHAA